jgi:hypothetical protein
MNKILLYILVGYGGYYIYKNYSQNDTQHAGPIVINEKDLLPVSKVPHDKSHNILYDDNGNQAFKIKHTFSDFVMPQVGYNQASHPYSTQIAYF